MANVVNLNRYRKMHTGDDRQKTAEANRAKHGRTKEARWKERFECEREDANLASKRLEFAARRTGPRTLERKADLFARPSMIRLSLRGAEGAC